MWLGMGFQKGPYSLFEYILYGCGWDCQGTYLNMWLGMGLPRDLTLYFDYMVQVGISKGPNSVYDADVEDRVKNSDATWWCILVDSFCIQDIFDFQFIPILFLLKQFKLAVLIILCKYIHKKRKKIENVCAYAFHYYFQLKKFISEYKIFHYYMKNIQSSLLFILFCQLINFIFKFNLQILATLRYYRIYFSDYIISFICDKLAYNWCCHVKKEILKNKLKKSC